MGEKCWCSKIYDKTLLLFPIKHCLALLSLLCPIFTISLYFHHFALFSPLHPIFTSTIFSLSSQFSVFIWCCQLPSVTALTTLLSVDGGLEALLVVCRVVNRPQLPVRVHVAVVPSHGSALTCFLGGFCVTCCWCLEL